MSGTRWKAWAELKAVVAYDGLFMIDVQRLLGCTGEASGIVNDTNAYANETMNNPAYPLELLARVVTVSLRTVEIVRNLPKLDI